MQRQGSNETADVIDEEKIALLNLINASWNVIESKKSPLPPTALSLFRSDTNLLEQIAGLIGNQGLTSASTVNAWNEIEEDEDERMTGGDNRRPIVRLSDKQNGYREYDGTQSPENDYNQQQLLNDNNLKHFSDVIANNGDIDVDSLCFSHRNDVNDDDNITLLPRWPIAGSHDVIKPTAVVPSYENLVNLQRDGPLYMYVPQPVVQSDTTVGDV
jgi:hypothetical protein